MPETDPTLENLANKPVSIKRRSETIFMPVWKDRLGNSITNSAGALPIKPMYQPVAVEAYYGRKWYPRGNFTDASVRNLIDSVNDDSWRGWEAGEAWVSEITSDEVNQNLTDYEKFQFVVRCVRGGWKTFIPDVGYYYIEAGAAAPFLDVQQNRVIGKLNGTGGSGGLYGSLIIGEFNVKRIIDFSTNLPF